MELVKQSKNQLIDMINALRTENHDLSDEVESGRNTHQSTIMKLAKLKMETTELEDKVMGYAVLAEKNKRTIDYLTGELSDCNSARISYMVSLDMGLQSV